MPVQDGSDSLLISRQFCTEDSPVFKDSYQRLYFLSVIPQVDLLIGVDDHRFFKSEVLESDRRMTNHPRNQAAFYTWFDGWKVFESRDGVQVCSEGGSFSLLTQSQAVQERDDYCGSMHYDWETDLGAEMQYLECECGRRYRVL